LYVVCGGADSLFLTGPVLCASTLRGVSLLYADLGGGAIRYTLSLSLARPGTLCVGAAGRVAAVCCVGGGGESLSLFLTGPVLRVSALLGVSQLYAVLGGGGYTLSIFLAGPVLCVSALRGVSHLCLLCCGGGGDTLSLSGAGLVPTRCVGAAGRVAAVCCMPYSNTVC